MELITRSARPIADLMQAERNARGIQDPDKYFEQQQREREIERISNEELDALLTGLSDPSPPVTMPAKHTRHILRDG
jgi:hypothetical protein